MAEKYVELTSKSDSSKPHDEDERENRNLELLYRNSPNPEKNSGISSDDETTSSSLIALPDTLRQMRNELKKTISDIGEHSEVESTCTTHKVVEERSEKVINSLDELRKKYTLKNEAAVAFKMNSANLLLDDILNSNSILNISSNNNCQSKFFKEQDYRTKGKSETLNSDSTTLTRVCTRAPLTSISQQKCSVATGFSSSPCPKHGLLYTEESSKIHPRRKSFLEKIQNLNFKYNLKAFSRMMNKNNPYRIEKECECLHNKQVISETESQDNDNDSSCKYEERRNQGSSYPKRMIFDLVESSDVSQSEKVSVEAKEKVQIHPYQVKCTCSVQKNCSCPEVLPRCICSQCTCKVKDHPLVMMHLGNNISKNFGKAKESLQTDPTSLTALSDSYKSQKEKKITPPQSQRSFIIDKKVVETNANSKIPKGWKQECREKRLYERTDIYYFDHGNSAYYKTTDNHPIRYTECIVERTDEYATKFWAEFFGAIAIGISFIISFIIQFFRFLLTSIIRSLTVGCLQTFSDYLFKPLLTIMFNGIIQPCLILVYNIATSTRDLCLPFSQIFGFFAKELANICRSIRLIEVNREYSGRTSCNCGNKV